MHVAVNARFLLANRQLEGLGRYTHEVVTALADAHPDDTFHLLFDRKYDERFLTRPNMQPHVLAPPARHPVLFLYWFEVSVARWLRRNRPDVFFSPDGYTTLATKVPRVTVFHDLAFEHFPRDIYFAHRLHYRVMTPRFVRHSTRVVTVSNATRNDLVDTYGTDARKITVAYPGIGPPFVSPARAAVAAAARDRFAGGSDYFIYVGAIQPRKNIPMLAQAFDAYKEATGASTKLLVVGRNAWKSRPVSEALAAIRHSADVVLTGPLGDDDLQALYTGALATVFVSVFEGFGLPVAEAMGCGCAVITSNTSSMPEVAGDAAILVDPRNASELAAALSAIANDPDMRTDLSAKARSNSERFRWASTADAVWAELQAAVS